MPQPALNLVDILDRIIALYGPTFAALFKERPEASGIRGYVGRDEPSALLKDESGRGYRDDEFEAKAQAALKPLVAETYAIAQSCSITRGKRELIDVDIDREVDGKVYLSVMVSDRLGAVFVRRRAIAFDRHGFGFFCVPAEIAIMAFSQHEADITNVIHAARAGLDEAMDYMIEADLVLNQKGKDARIIRKFADLFPTDGRTHISKLQKEAIWVMAQSTQQPYKLMVTAEAREEMEGTDFLGADFETLGATEAASSLRH